MKKNRIIAFAYLLALVFLANIFGSASRVLAATNDIELQLPAYEDLYQVLETSPEFLVFEYWDVSSDYSKEEYEEDRTKILAQLHDVNYEDLSKYEKKEVVGDFQGDKLILSGLEEGLYYFRNEVESKVNRYTSEFIVLIDSNSPKLQVRVDKIYVSPLEAGRVRLIKVDQDSNKLEGVGFELYRADGTRVPLIGNYVYSLEGDENQALYTDSQGQINVENLPYGDYYFKEVKGLEGYKVIEGKKAFSIKDETIVEVKVVNEKILRGSYKFLKVANDSKKTPLEGAVFKVSQLKDGKYIPVIQAGKELFVRSDKDGKFEVKDLEYGDYYIWEVEAPKGYRKLANGLKFTVDGESHTKLLVIKNDKPSKIPVPKTGDLVMPMLLISSLTLFGTGYRLTKSKEK